MISDVLESMQGIESYPIVALVIFFLIFLGIIIWSVRMDYNHRQYMKQLPLNDSISSVVSDDNNTGSDI